MGHKFGKPGGLVTYRASPTIFALIGGCAGVCSIWHTLQRMAPATQTFTKKVTFSNCKMTYSLKKVSDFPKSLKSLCMSGWGKTRPSKK